jgi:polyisoprenoid-binding protein YceI
MLGIVQKFGAASAFVLSLVAASSAFAQAKTFDITEGKVQFVSDAPLEKFTGQNEKVSGSVTVDPAKPADAKGTVKIDSTAWKTGIDLRNEHIQSDSWLDAKKFPFATFEITKVTGISALKEGESTEATVTGKFTLHGVTKELTAKAKIRLAAGVLHIQTSFPVKLEDHKISIPSIVALKVAPVVQANVDLKAKAK